MFTSIFGEPVGILVIDADRTNGAMTIAPETFESDNEVKPYATRGLAELSADIMLRKFYRELCDRPDVDNIWLGRKVFNDDTDGTSYATIMYHEYASGEEPNYQDPNRERCYLIATARQIKSWPRN